MPTASMNSTRGGRGDALVAALLFCASGLCVLSVAAILAFLAWFCLPLLSWRELSAVLTWRWEPFGGHFGILPMVVGSLALALSALLLAWPLGLGLTLFIHGLGPRVLARPLLFVVRLMTGVPTVVYGLVAAIGLVPLVRGALSGSGFCWLTTALMLALLALPTIVLVLDGQLALVAPRLRLTAAALGLTRAQELLRLALPMSGRGLRTAATLGFARALGDTLLPLMLSGNAAQPPHSLLDSLRALTAHIALVVATDSQSAAYGSLFACGLLLFGVSFLVNLGLRRLSRGADVSALAWLPPGRLAERLAVAFSWFAALIVPAALALLLGFLLLRGGGTLGLTLFFGDTPPLDAMLRGAPVFDGLWPACLGSLWLVGLSACLAVPLGVAGGIHLSEAATGRAGRRRPGRRPSSWACSAPR